MGTEQLIRQCLCSHEAHGLAQERDIKYIIPSAMNMSNIKGCVGTTGEEHSRQKSSAHVRPAGERGGLELKDGKPVGADR